MTIKCVVGATCSGKDHYVKQLIAEGWSKIVTCTTRPRRDGEVNGEDYVFLSEDDFEGLAKNGKLRNIRQFETVHGIWRYGVRACNLTDVGRKVIILDPIGAANLFRPENVTLLIAPYEVRRARASARGDDMTEFERRTKHDTRQIEEMIDRFIQKYETYPNVINTKEN